MVFSGRPPAWRALRNRGQALGAEITAAIATASRGSVNAGVAALLVVGLAAVPGSGAEARSARQSSGTVALSDLPQEAQTTYRLILSGGPFPSRKDGSVFGNFERALPAEPRGFYREYTVPTPGATNRGARRIVCGGEPPTKPSVCYYTANHYATFRTIAP